MSNHFLKAPHANHMVLPDLLSGWWYTCGFYTPLKNMSSSVGMMKFPINMKKYLKNLQNHQPACMHDICI